VPPLCRSLNFDRPELFRLTKMSLLAMKALPLHFPTGSQNYQATTIVYFLVNTELLH
jgi:hypothetical protein